MMPDRPRRIQLQRTPGWRKPEGAIVVSRPTKWGNPFRRSEYLEQYYEADEIARLMVLDFRHGCINRTLASDLLPEYPSLDEIRAELRGHDLCCWCKLTEPCHADVLLEVANA